MIEALYIHTLTVTRPTRTGDGQGGWTVTYETVGTIDGRLRPAGASEKTTADQEQAQVTHVLYCAADEDIQRGDLVMGTGLPVVEIIAVREPSYMGHHLECDCVEIQKEPAPEVGS
jgi:head-tail adaptor